ncbi:hypothetical protein GCM10009798_13650 [Nocardioides panacihumi]|uniref:Uncharacterized protein n=1 Tax=Nocardioides panacihumi TaxID=400774 RepID=A0ABP5C3U2_9ACTN
MATPTFRRALATAAALTALTVLTVPAVCGAAGARPPDPDGPTPPQSSPSVSGSAPQGPVWDDGTWTIETMLAARHAQLTTTWWESLF